MLERRVEDLLLEAVEIFAHHRDLQLLARTEMREHAGLAHVHDLGHRADAQPFETDLAGQAQGGIDDGGLGLLALDANRGSRWRAAQRPRRWTAVVRGGWERQTSGQNKTNDRAILRDLATKSGFRPCNRAGLLGKMRVNPRLIAAMPCRRQTDVAAATGPAGTRSSGHGGLRGQHLGTHLLGQFGLELHERRRGLDVVVARMRPAAPAGRA